MMMIRTLVLVALAIFGVSARQDEPDTKSQILLKTVLYTSAEDLWADVREADSSLKAIEFKASELARGLEKGSVEERTKATDALKSLGLAAFGAIKLERDMTASDEVRRALDLVLKELAGDWPGAVADAFSARPLTPAEAEALKAEVARLAKGLEADNIDDRSKAAGDLKALGAAAIGTIRGERHRTSSDQVRRELEAVLKELIGPSVAVPLGRSLGKADGEALKTRLGGKKLRVLQQPFITSKDGQPVSIFVGEEIPAGPGRRRLRLDANGRKLELKAPEGVASTKFGFQMLVKPKIVGEKRESMSIEIAITDSHVRRPIREMETPFGRVMDPEVIVVGVDLSANLPSGGHYLAGPIPSADLKSAPWWILIEAQIN